MPSNYCWEMNPVIIIPARLAATRLPDKPLADILGTPMIVHVWKRAIESGVGKVYVACDDERIAAAVRKAGGETVITRSDHVSGSDRIYEALQHIDTEEKYDVIVNVQGDVPTIDPDAIKMVVEPLQDMTVDIATLACEIKLPQEKTDPSVVKPILCFHGRTLHREGNTASAINTLQLATALYFTRATAPYGDGPLYHHIGIYAYRRKSLERFVSLPPSALEQREKLEQLRALEAGMKIGVSIVDTVPLGVDTPEHLERARKILSTAAAETV